MRGAVLKTVDVNSVSEFESLALLQFLIMPKVIICKKNNYGTIKLFVTIGKPYITFTLRGNQKLLCIFDDKDNVMLIGSDNKLTHPCFREFA